MAQATIEPTDCLVKVPGGTIFARRWTPTILVHHTPLILLHDSLGCVELWRDYPQLLPQQLGRPVVAYDRLGFGRSSARKERPGPDFKQIDLITPKQGTMLGIYEIKGDILRLSVQKKGARPASFDAKGEGIVYVEPKREKP